MRFRDTRTAPADGSAYLHLPAAGRILAEMFARGHAPMFRIIGKDPHRTPMSLRYQAALRHVQNERRLELFNIRQNKRAAKAGAK